MQLQVIRARTCRAVVAACLVLLVSCATRPGGEVGTKVALVIGNAAYENAPSLKNPVNDAGDMCTALRKLGFKTMCFTNLTDRAEFDLRVKEYVDQLRPNDVGVFYYSGHGVQVRDANFLIPTKVLPKSASESPVRVLYAIDDLFERLRQKPTKFQLVILDACRTDLFASPTAQPSGRAPPPASRSNLIRSLETIPSVGSGLAPITHAPADTMVLYATASKEAAFDGEGRNGPLTKHVLKNIGASGVPVMDFIRRVTEDVKNETERDYRKRQTPYIYGSFSGKFCFAGCPGEVYVPPLF